MPQSKSKRTTRGPGPVPAKRRPRPSPQWWAPAFLGLIALGVLVIVLNYLAVLPGAVTGWYLVAGFVLLLGGFVMATKWR